MKIPGIATSFITKEQLPLVIAPKSSGMTREQFFQLLAAEKDTFKKTLLRYGGLLFRGFPIHGEKDFAAAIKHLDTGEFADYIGGDSPRNKIIDGVYTSTEAPPSIKIPLHNELSFVKNYPKYIYFYCETPSPVGGETILGNARKIYQQVDPSVRQCFTDKGIRYSSCYYHKSQLMEYLNRWQRSHKSWTQVFETDSKAEVAKKCVDNDFELSWQQNDWLKIQQTRPAVIHHPTTQEPIWFNQVHLYDFNPKLLGWWRFIGAKLFYCRDHMKLHQVSYSDGSRIKRRDIYHIMDVLDANTVAFPWQKRDFLLLDNILTMHGRASFQGKRRVLAAMTG